VKPQSGVSKPKKRHVETLTRLPTKRMATACWDFIVAKSTPRETAPVLDFSPLQYANKEFHQQLIHKALWMTWGWLRNFEFIPGIVENVPLPEPIALFSTLNPGSQQCE